jgi:hypothetical protein
MLSLLPFEPLKPRSLRRCEVALVRAGQFRRICGRSVSGAHANSVSGVTVLATAARTRQPSRLALAARGRR